jgi:serine/threonine-protein kinase RsbW
MPMAGRCLQGATRAATSAGRLGVSMDNGRGPDARVTMQVPADSAYIAVLRTTTAGLAARLDFTLDDIEDLRMAVNEACALLLRQAASNATLDCVYDMRPHEMTFTVSAQTQGSELPSTRGLPWMVLNALAGTVDAQVGPDGRVSISLSRRGGAE